MNLKNTNGRTALMQAAEGGHTDIVKLLISAKAKIKTKDNKGATASILVKYDREEVKQLLAHASGFISRLLGGVLRGRR